MELLAVIGCCAIVTFGVGLVVYEIISHGEFWGGLSKIVDLSRRVSNLESKLTKFESTPDQ